MHYQLGKLYEQVRKQQINEALGLGTFNYTIPDDPKEMVYDFYYLSLLGPAKSLEMAINKRIWGYWADEESATGDPSAAQGTQSGYFNEEQIQDLIASVDETQKKLLGHIQDDLLDATYFAIASEFRYVLSRNDKADVYKVADKLGVGKEFIEWYKTYTYGRGLDVDKMVKGFMDKDDPLYNFAIRADLYKKVKNRKEAMDPVTGKPTTVEKLKGASEFLGSNTERIASYTAAKKAFSDDQEFIALAKEAFYKLKWSSSYGGKAWGEIAEGWEQLYNAQQPWQKMVYIDHLFDLEHNTGAMLNKVKRWSKNGSWDWIKQALDYKRDSVRPLYDFEDKISSGMSFLANRIKYALTGLAADREELEQLDKELKKVKVTTGAKLPKSSTGDFNPFEGMKKGDPVETSTGFKGTIHKIGTTGKAYVEFDANTAPALAPLEVNGYANHYFVKYGKDGQPEAFINKGSNHKEKIFSKKWWGEFGVPSGETKGTQDFSYLKKNDPVETTTNVKGYVANVSGDLDDETAGIYVDITQTQNYYQAKTLKFDKSGKLLKYSIDGKWIKAISNGKAQHYFGTIKPTTQSAIQSVKSGLGSKKKFHVGDKVITSKGNEGTVYNVNVSENVYVQFPNVKRKVVFNKEGQAFAYWGQVVGTILMDEYESDGWGILEHQTTQSSSGGFDKDTTDMLSAAGITVTNPPAVPADNAIDDNAGKLTDILAKFHPKPVKATGPAGKGGVNTLVIKMWLPQASAGTGRNAYSGYLKAKGSHDQSDDRLYYSQQYSNGHGKLLIPTKKGSKFIAPTDDKCVVKDLQFVMEPGKQLRITRGVVANAVIGPGVIIDGSTVLIGCTFTGGTVTSNFIANGKATNCKTSGLNAGNMAIDDVAAYLGYEPGSKEAIDAASEPMENFLKFGAFEGPQHSWSKPPTYSYS